MPQNNMPTVTYSSYRCHKTTCLQLHIHPTVNCDNYASLNIYCGFQVVISNKSKTETNNIASLISPYSNMIWRFRLMLNFFHLSCEGSRAVSQHPQASVTDKGTTKVQKQLLVTQLPYLKRRREENGESNHTGTHHSEGRK